MESTAGEISVESTTGKSDRSIPLSELVWDIDGGVMGVVGVPNVCKLFIVRSRGRQ
jgi:hypothetical protein